MPSSACKTCARSEEHTSELQSHDNLVCRLLLEKKKHPPHTHLHGPPGSRLTPPPPTHARARCWCGRMPHGPDCGVPVPVPLGLFFFLNDRAPPEIYPFSLHGLLPI